MVVFEKSGFDTAAGSWQLCECEDTGDFGWILNVSSKGGAAKASKGDAQVGLGCTVAFERGAPSLASSARSASLHLELVNLVYRG